MKQVSSGLEVIWLSKQTNQSLQTGQNPNAQGLSLAHLQLMHSIKQGCFGQSMSKLMYQSQVEIFFMGYRV